MAYPAIRVSLTSAGVKSGFASKVRATIPAIKGVAILVPLLGVYPTLFAASGAQIELPIAATSGFTLPSEV